MVTFVLRQSSARNAGLARSGVGMVELAIFGWTEESNLGIIENEWMLI